MRIKDLRDKYKDQFFSVVEDELRRLAKENPDFVYNPTRVSCGCHYNGPATITNDNGKTFVQVGPDCKGCIFGQALQNLGWDDKEELEFGESIYDLIPDCSTYWDLIQYYQDTGKTWAEAVSFLQENC